MGIHLPAQPSQAEGIALQAAGQHGDGKNHQQQPIDPLRGAEATVCQLEDTGFLIEEQLLTVEAPAIAPDHIQARIQVADQIPGLPHLLAGGMGQHQVGHLAAIGPEPHPAEAPAFAAAQAQTAHLTTQRRCGAMDLGVATLTLAVGCSSICHSSGMDRPWVTTVSVTTQIRFQSFVVSRARCTVWLGFCQLWIAHQQ